MKADNISFLDFEKIDIRLGTIIEAEEYNELNKPSILLKIDFGNEIGIKKSSAQLQKNYISDQLINKQVIAVVNFPPKQIGKIVSEVLVLGLPDNDNEPILISPLQKLQNGGLHTIRLPFFQRVRVPLVSIIAKSKILSSQYLLRIFLLLDPLGNLYIPQ